MIQKIFVFALLCATTQLQAQTIAMDWTKQDCDSGATHHLFEDLDNGFVVVQEYVMMNCSPCITGGHGLEALVEAYNVTNPGKIKMYQTSFNNTTTCSTMNDWAISNNFVNSYLFTMGSTEVNYYGGMGMPTIVIMGGAEHRVFHSQLGYSPSNNTTITAAIDEAIAASSVGVSTNHHLQGVQMSPNPVLKNLLVQSEKALVKSEILSLSGQTLSVQILDNQNDISLSLDELPTGMYFIRLTSIDGLQSLQKFVKQ